MNAVFGGARHGVGPDEGTRSSDTALVKVTVNPEQPAELQR
jgi:hypothetical protein